MEKKNTAKVPDVAGRAYHTSDYHKDDEVSAGLATTHEQVSDTYAEGEIGASIDDVEKE